MGCRCVSTGGTNDAINFAHVLPSPFDVRVLRAPAHWLRQLQSHAQPAYLQIADLIADDLRTGRLAPRDRLPTLRDLAGELSLNYTTVARAYAEARKRGLITSRPGRGTSVRSQVPSVPLRGGSAAEMTMNLPPEPQDPALLLRMRESAAEVLRHADLSALLRYQDFGGSADDKAAAVHWLQGFVPRCDSSRVLIAPGIHSVLAALVSQLARPGELICVEALTYPGLKAIATQLGVVLHALPLDAEGPSAAAFEHACKTLKPKALYCNPTMLNPTTLTMGWRRREALADIALRYSVPIIEDDAYGMLPLERSPPLASLAPDLTYYISGLSKCLGAGLRAAFVCSPNARQSQRLAGALRATTVMASPVTNALATRWISDGTAEAVLQAVRTESAARQALAIQHLAPHAFQAQPSCFHLWLPITSAWNSATADLATCLRKMGVAAVASSAFSTDGDPPDAVRICLGGPTTRAECAAALQLVAQALADPPAAP